MNVERYPIEGDFVLTEDHLFCEIKGFIQPPNKVLAYLRYIPSQYVKSGEREPRSRTFLREFGPAIDPLTENKYVKIYPLKERFEILKVNFPHYIFSHPNYHYGMQGFPPERVTYHFRPEKFVDYLDGLGRKDKLPHPVNDAFDLIKGLSARSDVPLKYFGITGSLLLGLWDENSDIDLIVYGFGNSLRVREAMRAHFNGAAPADFFSPEEFRKFTMSEFRDLYRERGEHQEISFYSFLAYEVRKLHQGIFRGRQFFLRFLEFETRAEYQQQNNFETQQIISLGRIHIAAEIRGDQNWWITPAAVELANIQILDKSALNQIYREYLEKYNLNLREIGQTFTLRGRYTENVRLLEQIEAKGTLELVVIKSASAYLQLSLGPNLQDYIIPL